MDQHSDTWSKLVFRVSALPNDVEIMEDVASLLSLRLGGFPVGCIRVCSLAVTMDYTLNKRQSRRTKVATVMFQTLPSLIQNNEKQQEWCVPARGHHGDEDVILDTHFMGMTPLNDVGSNHAIEYTYLSARIFSTLKFSSCIAISGLASHPFGSWQPKGRDKTFMWVRDALPKDLLGIRAVIYGYNTRLDSSQSFQTITDLAQALISQLQTYGWSLSFAKPVVFLAHSLGGLVLREAMVQLYNSSNDEYRSLLEHFRGALFFGVPNLGMEQSHFRMVAHNNPNSALVEDIARNSNYLHGLNDLFSRASFSGRPKFFWAYETSKSPTIQVSQLSRATVEF